MKKQKIRRDVCRLLVLAMIVGIVWAVPTDAKAKTIYETIYSSESVEAAQVGVEKSVPFSLTEDATVFVKIQTKAPANFLLNVTDSEGQAAMETKSVTVSDNEWKQDSDEVASYQTELLLKAGKYKCSLVFEEDQEYFLYIQKEAAPIKKPAPKLSKSALTLTAGFTEILTVKNAEEKITWKSSNSKIAAVNSKGKITAVKAGACTISAKTGKTTVKCKVTVKKNEFSQKKLTCADCAENRVSVQVRKVCYDSKGNLKITIQIVNNESVNIRKISSLTITGKDVDKKKILKYTIDTKKIIVKRNRTKEFAVTIPKEIVSKKTPDLRNASFSIGDAAKFYE